MKLNRNFWVGLMLILILSLVALSNAAASGHPKSIILTTTTSTQDSGLLDVLVPMFEKQTGYMVKTISVGSGAAMAMGRRGESDVLLVHSPAAEKEFVAQGFGVNRRIIMHNDFVIVGPPGDPAGIRGIKSATEALRRIAGANALFISRGDNSGTHAMEQLVWKTAGFTPKGHKWYIETGLGMGHTLGVSSEKKAYTLTDRGTFLALRKKLGLDILTEGDGILLNIYHVIELNPAKWPRVNVKGGRAFADFMVSAPAQEAIKVFGIDRFGSPLFFPNAGQDETQLVK